MSPPCRAKGEYGRSQAGGSRLRSHRPGWLAAIGLAAALAANAQDRADLDRSQIIGNRELPKVLYIVPWKKPLPGELSGRPAASVLDEALAPVDRDVFRRQLRYDALVPARADAAAPRPR